MLLKICCNSVGYKTDFLGRGEKRLYFSDFSPNYFLLTRSFWIWTLIHTPWKGCLDWHLSCLCFHWQYIELYLPYFLCAHALNSMQKKAATVSVTKNKNKKQINKHHHKKQPIVFALHKAEWLYISQDVHAIFVSATSPSPPTGSFTTNL